jgi:CRISPR-associated protein Csx3
MIFTIKELENFTIVHFELENPIKPEELKNLEIPSVNPRKGVIISGRGPIWLHCFLAHKYHHTKFVAIYDPRIGAVVVQSHADLKEGDVLDIVVEEVLR